jgi:hypothetical protein
MTRGEFSSRVLQSLITGGKTVTSKHLSTANIPLQFKRMLHNTLKRNGYTTGCGGLSQDTPPVSTAALIQDAISASRERSHAARLAATSCISLRLPSSAPVGSFHPTRFCPCWAHWGSQSWLPILAAAAIRAARRRALHCCPIPRFPSSADSAPSVPREVGTWQARVLAPPQNIAFFFGCSARMVLL